MTDSPVILDLGSGFIKAGFQTSEIPTCIFPSLVGHPRRRYAESFPGRPSFVGEVAVEQRQKLSFCYPIDHGHCENWAEMEDLLHHLFHEGLKIEPNQHPSVLATIPPFCSQPHQEKLVELLFELFDAKEVCLGVQGILALYATGRTTGLVVESGEGLTQVVPVYEGYTTKNAIKRMDFAGQELTMYLQKLLCDKGYQLTTRDDFEHVRVMKETLCYVAINPQEDDLRNDLSQTYSLPDGVTLRDGRTRTITLDQERFYCPEALFEPHLVGRDSPPLTELLWQSLRDCAMESRKPLLGSVVLSGGTSMFQGLPERVKYELEQTAPPQARGVVNVIAEDTRLFGVWLGARSFAQPSLRSTQTGVWITREEYSNVGGQCVLLKSMLR